MYDTKSTKTNWQRVNGESRLYTHTRGNEELVKLIRVGQTITGVEQYVEQTLVSEAEWSVTKTYSSRRDHGEDYSRILI